MKKTPSSDLAKKLNISKSKSLEATLKANLISAVLKAVQKQKLTHQELADRSGLPRSAVTGILSGSLQKVTIDRVLKLIEAAGLTVEAKIKQAV